MSEQESEASCSDSVERPPAVSRLIRRQRIVIVAAVTAAVLSLGGLVASRLVKSPAQQAAEQRPPAASLLTAPVQKKVLRTTAVVRGNVVSIGSIAFSPTIAAGTAALVVTALPKKVGDDVAAGDVIAQVSGRPVFALAGPLPVYRDLRPGETGPDITQLQTALIALGYGDADRAGTYGAGTKQAVKALYNAHGFDPATVSDGASGGDSSLQGAQTSVTQAQRKLAGDSAALAAAVGAPAISAAAQQVTYDKQDLATAQAVLNALVTTSGVEFAMSELVFVPKFPASLGSLDAQVGSTLAASSTPLLTIDTGNLAIQATVPPGQQQLIKAGQGVDINDDVNERSATGTVASLGPFTAGTAGGSAPSTTAPGVTNTPAGGPSAAGYPLLITPTTALASSWLGSDVRLTIIAATTTGPVLVVPAAAITSGADGTTSVSVLGPGGQRRQVVVTTSATANGEVEVTPVADAPLHAGDLVVTGQ